MTNNVNQPPIRPLPGQTPPLRTPHRINPLPLGPNTKRLLGPRPKANFLNDRRRDDFLAGESTPRDGVRGGLGIAAATVWVRGIFWWVGGGEVAGAVHGVEGDGLVGVEAGEEGFP